MDCCKNRHSREHTVHCLEYLDRWIIELNGTIPARARDNVRVKERLVEALYTSFPPPPPPI